jgi:hypothetical protein
LHSAISDFLRVLRDSVVISTCRSYFEPVLRPEGKLAEKVAVEGEVGVRGLVESERASKGELKRAGTSFLDSTLLTPELPLASHRAGA